jgi:RNA polymerase sigma-70 factor, ECF subfamily
MPSDAQLLAAAGDGDRDAFARLVVRHQHRAFHVAWRLLGNAADAEEVAQEAFLRILEAADRYRPTAQFTTYLYQVVTRLCIDRSRKKQPGQLGVGILQETAGGAPPDVVHSAEQSAAVRRAVASLPDRQRAAVVLRYYEGLPAAQVAKALQTTPKGVERLLARARDALRRLLPPDFRP